MKEFMNFDGNEYRIDQVLFASNYPILFTCVDNKQKLYICVCCQNNAEGKKWLLTQTTPKLIIAMLSDQIPIRDVFLKFPNCRISRFADEKGIEVKTNEEADWKDDSIFLPQAGEYMEAEEGEFDEEIAYYRQMDEKFYENDSFEAKMQYKINAEKGFELLKNLPVNDARVITSHILNETFNISLKFNFSNPQQQHIQYDREQKSPKNVKFTINDLRQKAEIKIVKSGKEGVILEAA